MNFNIFTGRSGKNEESGSAVRKAYASRIDDFLRNAEGTNFNLFRRRESSLDSLFAWGENVLDAKRDLERQMALQVRACQKVEGQLQKAEAHIDELKKALELAKSQFQKASIEKRNMEIHHAEETARLTIEKRNMEIHHAEETARLTMAHSKNMDDLQKKYQRDMNSRVQDYENRIGKLNKSHTTEVSKLVGQLLVNQDDNKGWPDEKLKLKFRELQRLIESVTSPHNKEFPVLPNQQLGLHLDPTNFLSRAGRGKYHFVLKSALWTIFREQFFSAPFGFGALGPGKAQRELMDVYATWRRLFSKGDETASPKDDGLAVFQQDRLANNWRSATFQCVNGALMASDGRNKHSQLARFDSDNINRTVDRIMAIFSEVSKLSNSSVRSEAEDEIRHMANLAREIALQFGVHSAQLRLSVPNHGEQVQIGEEFHDCEDGDCHKGSIYGVDLVIVPGLQKIGDGRSDMSSKRTIVPCEFYPDQSNS